MITVSFLLIIVTCLGLVSCCTPTKNIVHEIHYVPSYGATAPEKQEKEPINPNMPYCPKGHKKSPPGMYDDTNAQKEYKNKRQYPERGMSKGDSV